MNLWGLFLVVPISLVGLAFVVAMAIEVARESKNPAQRYWER